MPSFLDCPQLHLQAHSGPSHTVSLTSSPTLLAPTTSIHTLHPHWQAGRQASARSFAQSAGKASLPSADPPEMLPFPCAVPQAESQIQQGMEQTGPCLKSTFQGFLLLLSFSEGSRVFRSRPPPYSFLCFQGTIAELWLVVCGAISLYFIQFCVLWSFRI